MSTRTFIADQEINLDDDPDAITLVFSSAAAQIEANVSTKYLVSEQNPLLDNERVLISGNGISVSENVVNGTITISSTLQPQAPMTAPYVVSQSTSLPNSRVIVAGPGINIREFEDSGTLMISATNNADNSLAPIDSPFVVADNSGTLTNKRLLVAGKGIQIVDSPNDGKIIISTSSNILVGPTNNRPSLGINDQGIQYIDTTLLTNGKPIWWTGSKWIDSMGNVV